MNFLRMEQLVLRLFSSLLILSVTLVGCASTPDTDAAKKTPQAVIAEEIALENAIIAGDVRKLARRIDDEFEFVHGEGWRDGNEVILLEDRETWLASIKKQNYLYRILDSVSAEVFGNTAWTHGHYKASLRMPDDKLFNFDVWYIRLYEFRDGEWVWLKHLTVDGPNEQQDK